MTDDPTLPDLTHGPELRSLIAANLAQRPAKPFVSGDYRAAAVAIALAPRADGRSGFLLTLRAPRPGTHSGQYALPGGKLDPGEAAEDAARRELGEELGLACGEAAILGGLDDLPTTSGYRISPFILWLDALSEPRPDPREVADWFHIPLGDLFAEAPPGGDDPRDPGRGTAFGLFMPILGHRIYAPTAAMLWQFKEIALLGRDVQAPRFREPDFARR